MREKYTILYVDDEESNLNIFKNTFRREYNVLTAISAKDGLGLLDKNHIDLILTDQRMPEMDGVQFLKHAQLKFPNLNRILITAYSDFSALQNAINEAQIFQYIQKPWNEKTLRGVIEQALEVYRVKKENEELNMLLKEKNKELEHINKEILELDKLKSEFIATLSHEIRTPLNGIIGSFELIKQETILQDKSKSLDTLLQILDKSIKRLEKFTITAEHITWIKAKKYNLSIVKLDVLNLINEITLKYESELKEKSIIVKKQINRDLNFYADEMLVRLIFSELLDNAIKFTGIKSQIIIKSYIVENILFVEFIDEGCGFKDKVLKNIFKLFLTDGEYLNQNIGIDLALVKIVMDIHEGHIEVFNNNTKGATVKLSFKVD